MDILTQLQRQTQRHWLGEGVSQRLWEQVNQLLPLFAERPEDPLLIAEPDPLSLLAGFLAAQIQDRPVCLGNPTWGHREWRQAMEQLGPAQGWGSLAMAVDDLMDDLGDGGVEVSTREPWVLIPTGGSSGNIRFAVHTWQTLGAAVQGFQQHFQIGPVNSVCSLPLYHVSGLMQVLRAFHSGGQLRLTASRELMAGQLPMGDPAPWCISLVPTQLQRLLRQTQTTQWLGHCRMVFLGGAPSWPELLSQAQSQGIPLALCYGMTETAAQVVALLPSQFAAGWRTAGTPLPHARVTVVDDQRCPLPAHTPGRLEIQAKSLAWGYWRAGKIQPFQPADGLLTEDVGYLDGTGHLTLLGRRSDVIISGGENIYPTEVEAAIQATQLVADVAVLGLPDDEWGQCVTAVYVPQGDTPATVLQRLLRGQLARFKHPKRWVAVEQLPRNSQGKINRQQLTALARGPIPGSL